MLRKTRKLKGIRLPKKQQGGSDEIFDKIEAFFEGARETVLDADDRIRMIQRQRGTSNSSIEHSLRMLKKERGRMLDEIKSTSLRGMIRLRRFISDELHEAEQLRYEILIRKFEALLFLRNKIQSVLDSTTSHSVKQSLQRNERATRRNNRHNRWYTSLGKSFKKSVKSIRNSINEYFRSDENTGDRLPYYRDAIGNYDIMKDEFYRDPDYDN